jgi:Na+-driven multidrug efflux pump
MIYMIIAVCVISGGAGVKKPIYGGLTGLVLFSLIPFFFYKFDLTLFLIVAPIGFVLGLFFGGIVNWLFYRTTADKKRKPHYKSVSSGTGFSFGGGIVYTDEEQKNAKENQEAINSKR